MVCLSFSQFITIHLPTPNKRLKDHTVLFRMTFNAMADGQLSQLLSMNSEYTAIEAYNTESALLDININFDQTIHNAEFQLHQNRPNPFSTETVIGFDLSKVNEAILTIYHVNGTILYETQQAFQKEYNEVRINRKDLENSGLLYYRLKVGKHTAIKKMLLLK